MFRIYALGRIGKYKRKHTDIACVFVSPFRVMSQSIHLEKYGKIAVFSYH